MMARKQAPMLTPPQSNPIIRYYMMRVREAKERLHAGAPIDWDASIADVCALRNAQQPPIERKTPELEAPTEQPKLTEDEILKELGY